MHIQRMMCDIACLWEWTGPNFLNLVYEIAKNLKGVGSQNAIETHVITLSLVHKDYGAVGARSSTRAIMPT